MVGWAALLGVAALQGPQDTLASVLEPILRVRPIGLYGLTLAFPGLVAVTAAILARSLARR
jgi:hypothetical protein